MVNKLCVTWLSYKIRNLILHNDSIPDFIHLPFPPPFAGIHHQFIACSFLRISKEINASKPIIFTCQNMEICPTAQILLTLTGYLPLGTRAKKSNLRGNFFI